MTDFKKLCEPDKLDFCSKMKMAMTQQWITIRQYGDKMYVCCYILNQEEHESFVADLKDVVESSVTLKDGKNMDITREQQIKLKKGRMTILHLFEHCSFCGVKLDLPGPKKTQQFLSKSSIMDAKNSK